MKLNKFLLSVLIVPALSFVGCSDYEDTEVASPQADENAIGANFKSATTTVTVHPDKNEFTLTLNRVNAKEAITVPVTVKSCETVDGGAKFCEQPAAFLFAAGESKSTVTLKLNDKCKYQKTYQMKLSIGDAKDHLYAAGTSATTVSVTKDYVWKRIGQPVVIEDGWKNLGALTQLQVASDYKDKTKQLFRIKAFYYYANIAAVEKEHLQFYLDQATYSQVTMFTSADGVYDPQNLNSGIPVDEDAENANYYFMKVTDAANTDDSIYTFTYDLFYKEGGTTQTEAQGVTLTFDFDIKSAME